MCRLMTMVMLLVLATIGVTSSLAPKFPGILPQDVIYLGTADQKSFFAEMTPKRNWTAARQFCISSNMQLASITTAAQATLLQNAFNNETFSEYFWTGGRDAQTLSQMVWDSNNQTANNRFIPLVNVPEIQTCLVYGSLASPEFRLLPCNGTYGTMCEISY